MSLRRLSLPNQKKPDRRLSDSDMRKASQTASFIFRGPDKNKSLKLPKAQKRKHWNRQNEEDVSISYVLHEINTKFLLGPMDWSTGWWISVALVF